MIAIVAVISTSHSYHFLLGVGTIKIQSLSQSGDHNTVLLSTFTILCIRSLGFIYYLLQVCLILRGCGEESIIY